MSTVYSPNGMFPHSSPQPMMLAYTLQSLHLGGSSPLEFTEII